MVTSSSLWCVGAHAWFYDVLGVIAVNRLTVSVRLPVQSVGATMKRTRAHLQPEDAWN